VDEFECLEDVEFLDFFDYLVLLGEFGEFGFEYLCVDVGCVFDDVFVGYGVDRCDCAGAC